MVTKNDASGTVKDIPSQVLTGVLLPAVGAGSPGSDLVLQEGKVRRTVLPGGIRVITEKIAGIYSATLGLWVARGSRDENVQALGSTHFLEHLLFKGTPSRSAKDIASLFDQIGGHSNAVTSKESTHYYATVIGEDLPLALDCLLDMVRCASLNHPEFEVERRVIMEELAMDLDDGENLAHETFMSHLFPHHPLGRPVGGSVDTVRATTLEAVKAHYQVGYTPDQLVVAVGGNVNHQLICDQILQAMQKPGNPQWENYDRTSPARDFSRQVSLPLRPGNIGTDKGSFCQEGNFEQAYLILGGLGIPAGDPRELTLLLLRTILGGGMSSRLFQNIREERGLAYNTYAFHSAYRDAGAFGLGASCNPQNADEVMKLMRAELERMAGDPVTEEELERAKGQLRGSTLLALERSHVRASHLAESEITLGRYISVEQKLNQLRHIGAKEILDLAKDLAANAQLEIRVTPVS